MISARFLSKGSDAEVAAAAATHGLRVELDSPNGPQRYGLAFIYPGNRGAARFYTPGSCTWFAEAPDRPPYPPGTLLFFTLEGEGTKGRRDSFATHECRASIANASRRRCRRERPRLQE